jgi:hypothetical protein
MKLTVYIYIKLWYNTIIKSKRKVINYGIK